MTAAPADVTSEIAATFDRAAPHYDRGVPFFNDFAADLVAWRPPSTGRVLDLCTGSGAGVRALCASVGPDRLVGVDMSAGMLARARESLPDRVRLVRADAHRLPFADASFGAFYCALSWQLLAEPERVLAELLRVGCPAAGLTLSVLGRSRHTWHFMGAVLRSFLGTVEPRLSAFLRARWGRPVEEALGAGGWRVRSVREVTRRFDFDTAQRWLTWQSAQVGRRLFELVAPDQQADLYTRLLAEAERVRAAEGLWMEQTVRLVHAEPDGP